MAGASVWPPMLTNNRYQFFDNVSGNAETFEANSKCIFIGGDEIDVEVCTADPKGCSTEKLTSVKELKLFFGSLSSAPSSQRARIFFLSQRHSRSKLVISKEAMMLIMNQLMVFPGFVNLISTYSQWTREKFCNSFGLSSFYARNFESEDKHKIFETGYQLLHAERNGRDLHPFSIRQMSVYQKSNVSNLSTDCLLFQLSHQVRKRFADLGQDDAIPKLSNHWNFLHEVYLGTLSQNWQSYILYNDKILSEIGFDYLFHEHSDNSERLDLDDLKTLNWGLDTVTEISHALDSNIAVLNQLSQEATRREAAEGETLTERYSQFQESIKTTINEQSILKYQNTFIQNFAERRLGQLRDAIALQDSNAMMALNHKAIRETQTMRIITLVALIYLPASFTATFLSMGFIHVESLSGVMRLNVSQDMWFYLAITAPLMVATLLTWGLWELKNRRRARILLRVKKAGAKVKDV